MTFRRKDFGRARANTGRLRPQGLLEVARPMTLRRKDFGRARANTFASAEQSTASIGKSTRATAARKAGASPRPRRLPPRPATRAGQAPTAILWREAVMARRSNARRSSAEQMG